MSVFRTVIANSVLVNLLFVVITVAGVVTYLTMPREIFPEFSFDAIRVVTEYRGASAEEVEQLVTIKLEDAIDRVEGIESIESTSQESLSTIVVKLKHGEEVARAIDDIKAEIDTIDDLPADAEDPKVSELKARFPVITVSIFGDLPELTMKRIADEVERRISDLPGVARVGVAGSRQREVWVEVAPAALQRYQLSLEDVRRALLSSNLNVPGGTLKTARGELLVRTVGEVTGAAQVENLIVRADPLGNHLYVRDLASVRDTFEEPTTLGRFNGKPAINLTVTKTKAGDAIQIARQVRGLAQRLQRELPPGVELGVFNDFSIYLRNRLNTLKNNGAVGLVIVFIILCLVLDLRMALMTAIGIPFAFLGALVLMNFTGISLNMLSMFSLILVLGMIVDDAIVIGENVYRYIEEGMEPAVAAVRGVSEVAWPVIATVTTTIAAFLPMLLMTGNLGKFMQVIPIVVSFALAASLFEALFILPSHLADWVNGEKVRQRFQSSKRHFQRALDLYARMLRSLLAWRYVSVVISICITVLFVLFAFVQLPFQLFSEFEATQFFINVETPIGASLETTAERVKPIETLLFRGLPPEELVSVSTNVGVTYLDSNRFELGSHLAQLIVELREVTQRKRSSEEIIAEVRERLRAVSGLRKLQVVKLQAGPVGAAIEVVIVGEDYDVLQPISTQLKAQLASFRFVKDIRDDYTPGKTEAKVYPKERAWNLGLSVAEIARQVRQSFYGEEASKIQTSYEDIPIVVKFPEAERRTLRSIEDLLITTPSGEKVYFDEVAELKEEPGQSKVVRRDRKRAITVLADIDQKGGNALQVTNAVLSRFADLERRYPGYRLVVKGERKETEESFQSLLRVSIVALFLVYLILGGLFKSYLQPLVVLFAIPFAVNGVILGHVVMGQSLTILSMLGLVALAGIVVNDSLVLVDLVNRLRRQGVGLREALVQGGILRMRPILLTSITTVGGLFSMAFLASGQARFLSPMAQTIIWGLTFSTILTLVVLPCFYAVLDDLLSWVQRLLGWEVSGTVRQATRGPAQAARDGGEEAGASPAHAERSEAHRCR